MLLMAAVFLGISLNCLALYFWTARSEKESELRKKITDSTLPSFWWSREVEKPLMYRLLRPLLQRLDAWFGRFFPVGRHGEFWEQRLVAAGNPWDLTVSEFLALKSLGALLGLGLSVLLLLLTWRQGFTGMSGWLKLSLLLLFPLAGYTSPDLILRSVIANRQTRVRRQLPDVVDLLAVSVEAGMGFEGALLRVIEKMKGPLAQEFRRVFQEVRMGRPRSEALQELSRRLEVEEVASFTGAVNMAEQLGTPLAQVLRVQAEEMRRKRRQKAEEAAHKAPVKMLFPLIFFIFPTIFLVLLGPAVLRAVKEWRF
ncbi:type II secretion system F family protein [Desulfothermobacter acidiphilus]|uniref:type II secretion system F family protein n=1 Tax=Desulfothermobacter acidiphilus TaxID=1938353 RepID=UPI003F8C6AA6